MARQVDAFPSPGGSKRGPKPKYPWDLWTNGAIWEIKRGEDYTVSTVIMQINLHQHARKTGVEVRTQSTCEGLVFKFYRALPPF